MRRITHISTQAGTNSHYVKDYYLKLSPGNYDWIDYKEHGVLKVRDTNSLIVVHPVVKLINCYRLNGSLILFLFLFLDI